MSYNKVKAGHLHAVTTEEQVEIGLPLQTLIKEYKTFMFHQLHQQNKDIGEGFFRWQFVNYYEPDEYGVTRICFKGIVGTREAFFP